MKKPQEQMKDQLEWLKATAHTTPCLLDIGIGDAGHSVGAFFLRAGQHELSPTEIMRRSPFYRAANARGLDGRAHRPLNIYLKSSLQTQSWLMLDDLTLEQCCTIAADRTHAIIQTSPGLHHLWLATTRAITVAERQHCQLVLIHRFGCGDLGSADGDHFGRLAGFKNAKRNCWVNLISAHISDRRADVEKLLVMPLPFSSPGGGGCSNAVGGVLVSQGVAPQAQSPSRSSVSSPQTQQFQPSDRDESKSEFAFACAHFEKNLDVEDGILRLAQRALSRGKRATVTSAEAYARKTFSNAECAQSCR